MHLRSSGHSFQAPPVYETTLAIQFEDVASFTAVHFGLFYPLIASRFPVVEDQPRTPPIIETFPLLPQEMVLKLMQKKFGAERVVFRDSVDGSLLIHVQPDRFALSWKRTSDGERYPRFDQNGSLFLQEFGIFEEFCKQNTLPTLRPNLCEVVYLNQIFPNPDESAVECMERVLAIVSLSRDNGLPPAEVLSLNRVYALGNGEGRLYIESGIAPHPEKGLYVQVKITARIMIDSNDLGESLQKAHDAAVQGFLAVTTDNAKSERWGQLQ